MCFTGWSPPRSGSTPRQSRDRLGYRHQCTKQEVRAGCGLVMGAESHARVSLVFHFTKLTAHLFDLLLSSSEFNTDAGGEKKKPSLLRVNGGRRGQCKPFISKLKYFSFFFFFQFLIKAPFTRCYHLGEIKFWTARPRQAAASSPRRDLGRWNIDESVDEASRGSWTVAVSIQRTLARPSPVRPATSQHQVEGFHSPTAPFKLWWKQEAANVCCL